MSQIHRDSLDSAASEGEPRGGAVQSVTRALDILEALAEGAAGVSEIGRRVGLSASTTHRMLTTLAERGYVERSAASSRYSLGHRAAMLAGTAHASEAEIRAAARPLMARVAKVAGETANLSVLDGQEAVFVEQAFNPASGSRFVGREIRLPAHATASGKAMLAFAAPDRVRRLYATGIEAFTPHTIVHRGALEEELAGVRRDWFAVDRQECKRGFVCVAAPVFDRAGAAVAALSVGAWTTRIGERAFGDLAELVGQSCAEVSAALGYRGPTGWAPGA